MHTCNKKMDKYIHTENTHTHTVWFSWFSKQRGNSCGSPLKCTGQHVVGWTGRTDRVTDDWETKMELTGQTLFWNTHAHCSSSLSLFFLNCLVRSHTETCPYIELEETQTVEQCRWLQSYKWGHWARLSFRRDKHGGGSKSIWKPPSTTGWTDPTFGDTWKVDKSCFWKVIRYCLNTVQSLSETQGLRAQRSAA